MLRHIPTTAVTVNFSDDFPNKCSLVNTKDRIDQNEMKKCQPGDEREGNEACGF